VDGVHEVGEGVEEEKDAESPAFFSKALNGNDHTNPAKDGGKKAKD
jgi:hypothetical protein